MATVAGLLKQLVESDLDKLNAVLINLRETLNAINSIDVEQIERVGAAAKDTIAVLKELDGATPDAQ
jgi:hypothetical protein